jgi:Fingers domain of DNA polymerase lambda
LDLIICYCIKAIKGVFIVHAASFLRLKCFHSVSIRNQERRTGIQITLHRPKTQKQGKHHDIHFSRTRVDSTKLQIEEYLSTGHVSEARERPLSAIHDPSNTTAETILEDNKYHILNDFASIYGVGPVTAKILYSEGLRTLEDLKSYYKVPADLKATTHQKRNETFLAESWIDVSLALKEDLSIKCVLAH